MDPLWHIDPISRQTPVVGPIVPARVERNAEREASQDDPRRSRRPRPPRVPSSATAAGQATPEPDADGHIDVHA